MVTAFCRAKDPRTCKYHSAQMLMLQAQSEGNLHEYLKYRTKLEDLERLGDLEDSNWQVPERQELLADTQQQQRTRQAQPQTKSQSPVPAPEQGVSEVIRSTPKSTVEAGTIPLTTEPLMQQRNRLFDVVEAPVKLVNSQGKPTGKTENVKFYLHKKGVTPVEPAYIRIQTNQHLSTEDVRALSGLLGYAYRVEVGGARLGYPQHDTPFSFIVKADTANANPGKSGDKLPAALTSLEAKFDEYLKNGGSPRRVRQNNTRAIEIEDGNKIEFRVFYDSVAIDVPTESQAAPATETATAPRGSSKNFTSGQLQAGLRPGGKLRTQYAATN